MNPSDESGCLHKIRVAGCSPAQRGGETYSKNKTRLNPISNTSKTLTVGSRFLFLWCGFNLFFSALILTIVVFHFGNSPLLAMVFAKSEIASLDAKVITSLNTLTILYNSYAVALSVLAWFVIRLSLSKGQKWAFWTLLFTIGFVEIFAFIASAPLGHVRWQFNVPLSALYVVGISLSGYSLFNGDN